MQTDQAVTRELSVPNEELISCGNDNHNREGAYQTIHQEDPMEEETVRQEDIVHAEMIHQEDLIEEELTRPEGLIDEEMVCDFWLCTIERHLSCVAHPFPLGGRHR